MDTRPSPLHNLLRKAFLIEREEIAATLSAFGFVLVLMTAWYILRPVRDAMSSDWSDAQLSTLWTLTFVFSAIAVSIYGAAVARLRLRTLVPAVYVFFAASFVAVYFGTQQLDNRDWLDQGFYVWVSVFSLFHVSVFWSFMAEIFSRPQSQRLFGFIGAGASCGGLLGPLIPVLFAQSMGTDGLLLLAAGLLVATLPLIGLLQRQAQHPAASNQQIGGNPFAGFSEFLSTPFLLAIGLFILLYTSISSFVYFELKNLLADYDREARAQIWAGMDLAVNILTITVAALATGRIATRFGLPTTLASVPLLIAGGLLVLAAAPLVAVVVAVQVIRRAGNYAITRPGREMLFTAVDSETRFKTKPVIDIVIYRGGDMLNAWAFTALTQGLGLGLAAVAGIGAGIAAVWAVVGIYLGREFQRRSAATAPDNP